MILGCNGMKYFVFLILLVVWNFGKDFLETWAADAKKHWDFDWPIATEHLSERVTSVFGESRWDHFHNGVDIASFSENARSMGEGRILYTRYSSDDPFRQEWGSGETVWVDHGKGAYSAYYHLQPGRKRVLDRVAKGQEIGVTGNTGHSSGGHLHFVLTMDHGKKIVNPLHYLPKIQDTTPPTIGGLSVHVGDRYTNINSGDSINLSDKFPFSVQIVDSGVRASQRWGVPYVRFSWNGKVIQESRFDSIQFRQGKWVNDDGVSFPELFFRDRYLIGELSLPAGEHNFEVIATDYHGNTAVKNFTFYVNRI